MKRKSDIAIDAPQSREEADAALARLADLQTRYAEIDATMRAEAVKVGEKFGSSLERLEDEIKSTFDAIHTWAAANRKTIQPKNAKTVTLSSGSIGWRMPPPSIRLTNVDAVIANIKAHRWGRDFLRSRVEVNKDALLDNRSRAEKITGVSFRQVEQFFATPRATKAEVAGKAKK